MSLNASDQAERSNPSDASDAPEAPGASTAPTVYDALIIGGGPAGSAAAITLRNAGRSVAVFEKAAFPRFHIGESMLPWTWRMLQDLGALDAVRQSPHVPKFGAQFAMGHTPDDVSHFDFDQCLFGQQHETFNIERRHLDTVLLNQARTAGADVFENVSVTHIDKLEDGDVQLQLSSSVRAAGRWLIDASGQNTVVGRHLNLRQTFQHPQLQRVAYFEHFRHVHRDEGRRAGYISIVMCDEGWFWMIPVNDEVMSVGLVIDPQVAKACNTPANQMLRWGIARCPFVMNRMQHATGPATNLVAADFTYTCKPYAGRGYFLTGDAARFLDPVFSAGVSLALSSGIDAAKAIDALLANRAAAKPARKAYIRQVTHDSKLMFSLLKLYYQHACRELFMEGRGPFRMKEALLTILTANHLPKTPWSVRWRYAAFRLCVALQRTGRLTPRRKPHALIDTPPAEMPKSMSSPVSLDAHGATHASDNGDGDGNGNIESAPELAL